MKLHSALIHLIETDWDNPDSIPSEIAKPIVEETRKGNHGHPNTTLSVRYGGRVYLVKAEHRYHQGRGWGYHCCLPEKDVKSIIIQANTCITGLMND